MTRADIAKIIAVLKNEYPEAMKDFSETNFKTKVDVWHSEFKNVENEVFQQAIRRIIRQNKYFPRISDIFRELTENPNEMDPHLAFADVKTAVKKFGSYDEINALKWLHPEIAAVVKMIGWSKICYTQNDKMEWVFKEFAELLKSPSTKQKAKILSAGFVRIPVKPTLEAQNE